MGSGNNLSAIGLMKFSKSLRKTKGGIALAKRIQWAVVQEVRELQHWKSVTGGGEVPVGYPEQKMNGEIQRSVKPLRATKRENWFMWQWQAKWKKSGVTQVLDVNNLSRYGRLLTVTAWTECFLFNLRSSRKGQQRKTGTLHRDEVATTENTWIKACQEELQNDKSYQKLEEHGGILRCRGRLQNSDLDVTYKTSHWRMPQKGTPRGS